MGQPGQANHTREDGRVAWVDYAKGFCIVFVVMMHSTLGVGNALGADGWLHAVVAFAKPFRMPDFFLISGLFLARVIDRDWRIGWIADIGTLSAVVTLFGVTGSLALFWVMRGTFLRLLFERSLRFRLEAAEPLVLRPAQQRA